MSVRLDEVVPWGRSRHEYELMFRLEERDLAKRILGCADGPASFNAEMTREGRSVLSVDPLYEFSGEEIRARFEATVDEVMVQVQATPDDWTWTYHRNSTQLRQARFRVMEAFVADYESGRRAGRYQVGSLPTLPFGERQFDLALCSHFLFLYSGLLSRRFHVESALELCRVADEVRIFPLLTLSRDFSPHVEPVREALLRLGVESRIDTVEYELQKGGNQMLRLFRKA